MKKQILISLISLSSILTINAQTRVPNDGISPLWYNNGNIGIGTGIAGSLLTLENSNSPTIEFKTSGTSDLLISGSSASTIINSLRTNPIYFQINSGTVMTVAGTTNVGIGTTTPSAKLDVNGNFKAVSTNGYILIDNVNSGENYYNASSKHIFQGGNVGIGALNPGSLLTLDNSSTPTIEFRTSGTQDLLISGSSASTIINSLRTNPIYFQINSGTAMTVAGTGRIGIGTTNPAYALDVIGTIRAREIKVDLNGADFVFESSYKLMPLNELENFTKEKKHLPEIAPAKEMEKNGTDLGVLTSKLLQKIEELTLYTIEQNKKIIELEKQNKIIEELKQMVKLQNEKIEKIVMTSK